jgi:formate dehydrogenase subunit delta
MHTGSIQHIVQMANDIGSFFRAETNRQAAVDGIASHINRYWTKRMRQKLLEYVQQGGTDLDELPRAAVAQLNAIPAVTPTVAALRSPAAPSKAGTTPTPAPAPGPTPERRQ